MSKKLIITKTGPVLNDQKITVLFDPREEIKTLKEKMPVNIKNKISSASAQKLSKGLKLSYSQILNDFPGAGPVNMVVEFTQLFINMPYETFLKRFNPADWGQSLAGYIGGEVQVIEKDKQNRPVRQLERMVLTAPLRRLDMTKSEVIVYEDNKATVYWRVYHSDNKTTKTDIGYVEFSSLDQNSTCMTFHSAHKLYLPNFLVRITLAGTFMKYLKTYRKKVV